MNRLTLIALLLTLVSVAGYFYYTTEAGDNSEGLEVSPGVNDRGDSETKTDVTRGVVQQTSANNAQSNKSSGAPGTLPNKPEIVELILGNSLAYNNVAVEYMTGEPGEYVALAGEILPILLDQLDAGTDETRARAAFALGHAINRAVAAATFFPEGSAERASFKPLIDAVWGDPEAIKRSVINALEGSRSEDVVEQLALLSVRYDPTEGGVRRLLGKLDDTKLSDTHGAELGAINSIAPSIEDLSPKLANAIAEKNRAEYLRLNIGSYGQALAGLKDAGIAVDVMLEAMQVSNDESMLDRVLADLGETASTKEDAKKMAQIEDRIGSNYHRRLFKNLRVRLEKLGQ